MTEPSDPEDPKPPAAEATHRYLGLTTFTIEGRRAPALFVVGWLATLVGGGFLAIWTQGIPGIAGLAILVIALAGLSLGLFMLAGSQTIERRAALSADAGPAPLLIVLAAFATYALLSLLVAVAISQLGLSLPAGFGDLVLILTQAVAFFGIVRIGIVGPGVLSWRDMGWIADRAAAIRAAINGAVFAGPVILATAVVTWVVITLAGVTAPSPLPPTGTPLGLVLHLLAGAVVAPFSEELLFRGYALTAWRRTVGVRGAIIRSSVVFVLAHLVLVSGGRFEDTVRMAFVAGAVRLPVSFVLGWLFVRTGSIWAPVGLHAAFNGILILLAEAAARA